MSKPLRTITDMRGDRGRAPNLPPGQACGILVAHALAVIRPNEPMNLEHLFDKLVINGVNVGSWKITVTRLEN